MWRKLIIIAVVLGVIGAAAGGALYYVYPVQVSVFVGLTRSYFLTWFAPQGTTTTELNAAYKDAGAVAPALPPAASSPSGTAEDWPSYNRAHVGTLLAAQSDQYEQCRQAEGLVHVRRR